MDKGFRKQIPNGCTLKIKGKREDDPSEKYVAFFVQGGYFKAAYPKLKMKVVERECLFEVFKGRILDLT